jgi:hypothetical protein
METSLTLDNASFDQDEDILEFHKKAQVLLGRLAGSKEALTSLLQRARVDAHCRALSESLSADDKIVLHDSLHDRGFRVRLHVSKSQIREVPHDHRFHLTTLILHGGYYQRIYQGTPDAPVAGLVRFEDPGACYTLHADTIHSNIAVPGTTLLILRGPTLKRAANGLNVESGAKYLKYGAADEAQKTLQDHVLTDQRFEELMARLAATGLAAA